MVASVTTQAKRSVLEVDPAELAAWMVERGFPKFHAQQVYRWIFDRRAEQFDAMSDVSRRLREALEAEWSIFATTIATHHVAPDGTDKLLLECPDGRRVECVLMAEEDRRTVCISTQVGCGMGCVFCASGLRGVERNLTRGEIIEQVVRLRNLLPPEGERLTNLVVMGMGESLANLDNLVAALDQDLFARRGWAWASGGSRSRRLACPTRCASSRPWIGPSTTWRSRCMPRPRPSATSWCRSTHKVGLNGPWSRPPIVYFQTSGRQVTFEYVLLRGINDRVEADARALAHLLDREEGPRQSDPL